MSFAMIGSAAHARFLDWFKTLDISISAMAERLGCDQSVISRLISGQRGIGLQLVLAIERESSSWERGPIKPGEWAIQHVPRRKDACQVPRAARKRRKPRVA